MPSRATGCGSNRQQGFLIVCSAVSVYAHMLGSVVSASIRRHMRRHDLNAIRKAPSVSGAQGVQSDIGGIFDAGNHLERSGPKKSPARGESGPGYWRNAAERRARICRPRRATLPVSSKGSPAGEGGASAQPVPALANAPRLAIGAGEAHGSGGGGGAAERAAGEGPGLRWSLEATARPAH